MPEQTIFPSTVVRTSRGLTVAGTRITLYGIMDYVKAGSPPEVIRDAFKLTIKQTRDVIEYIHAHQAEVETEYQQVVAEAEQERHYWEELNRERFARLMKTSPTPGKDAVQKKLRTLNRQNHEA